MDDPLAHVDYRARPSIMMKEKNAAYHDALVALFAEFPCSWDANEPRKHALALVIQGYPITAASNRPSLEVPHERVQALYQLIYG